jgi:hypothetical protein
MTDNHDMIAAGRAAWERLRQEGRRSWDDWVLVAKALAAGRSKAMQKAKCNKPVGTTYVRIFGAWLREHDLADMDNQARYRALVCLEHIVAIEAWRATLTQRERDRWNHPNSCWMHYRRSLKPASVAPRRVVNTKAKKGYGHAVHWPQDVVKRVAMAIRENYSADCFVMARKVLERAFLNQNDLLALIDTTKPAPAPNGKASAAEAAHARSIGDKRFVTTAISAAFFRPTRSAMTAAKRSSLLAARIEEGAMRRLLSALTAICRSCPGNQPLFLRMIS